MCLARGEYRLSLGALLLAFTNIVSIQVAGSIVMWLCGYRGEHVQLVARGQLKRNILSVALVCILAVLLGLNLRQLIRNEMYEASVRKILSTAGAEHKGAHLTEVRFQRDSQRAVVVAVYRTPVAFTPEEVGSIEPRLPLRPGDRNVELRIRSIPVTVASKGGYLYSSEDLAEYGLARR